MAISLKNLFGRSAKGPDIYETAATSASAGQYGSQPIGSLIGKEFRVPYDHLFEPYHWKQTLVSVGATSSTVVTAASASLPQHLVITTGSTNGDGVNLQYAAATDFSALTTYAAVTPFVCKKGYDICMRARIISIDEATSVGLLLGLSQVDTTLLGSGVYSSTDLVGFYKPTASTGLLGVVRTGSTSTSTSSLATIAVATAYDLEMRVSGRTSVTFYVNGVKTYQSTMTNLPANTVLLTPSLAFQTMSSAAQVLKLQSFTVSQEAI